jgi:hypothetical protein
MPAKGDREEEPSRQSVTISGGTFEGVNVVGQGNEVHTGRSIVSPGQPDIDDLRARITALVDQLSRRGDDAEHAVARDRAEQLAEELAESEPEPKRVVKLWDRLRASLDVVKVGVDIAKLTETVTHLFQL